MLKSVRFGSWHSKNGSFGAPGTTRRRRWSRPARLAPTLGIDLAIPFTLPARTSGPPSHSRINASDFLFVAPYLPVPLLELTFSNMNVLYFSSNKCRKWCLYYNDLPSLILILRKNSATCCLSEKPRGVQCDLCVHNFFSMCSVYHKILRMLYIPLLILGKEQPVAPHS